MAANTIFTNTVKLRSDELLLAAKYLCQSNDHPSQSIVSIQLEKVKAGELTRLCAQIDETARAPIEALIQKAQTKLAFAEKVNGYLSAKSESVDPRLEKLMAKITQMKEGPKAPNRNDAFTELFKLQNKLNNFAKHEHNPMTTEALAKARVMLGEIDMQIVNSPINLDPSMQTGF